MSTNTVVICIEKKCDCQCHTHLLLWKSFFFCVFKMNESSSPAHAVWWRSIRDFWNTLWSRSKNDLIFKSHCAGRILSVCLSESCQRFVLHESPCLLQAWWNFLVINWRWLNVDVARIPFSLTVPPVNGYGGLVIQNDFVKEKILMRLIRLTAASLLVLKQTQEKICNCTYTVGIAYDPHNFQAELIVSRSGPYKWQ